VAKKKAVKEAAKFPAERRVGPVTDITKSRHIRDATRCLLWGKAAGRCEFSGCNRELWKSPVTQEQVNIAEAAHIYAFSSDGPRGNDGIDIEKLNEVANLMLACHDCHKTMDNDGEGERYSVELLQQWKAEHERRIEIVTGVDPKKKSHVVLYGAGIGEHNKPLNFAEAAHALFPGWYPAEDRPIALEIVDGIEKDSTADYWKLQRTNLETKFRLRVKERIERGEIEHISVFALAPQPMLILLGTLMIDITPAEVYQRHREPTATWDWPSASGDFQFQVSEPPSFKGPPALVLALSAPVNDERITSVLDGAAIWKITVPQPNTDLVKSREQLSRFRTLMRELLDRIKSRHGQEVPLHIFPVAGVSPSVELGRIRMPKAHMPWKIYDQNNQRGGFVPALDIPENR
jgi:5-methylcytosine-specific restriction endonuclease McrA